VDDAAALAEDRGQAAVELLAGLPALVLAALIAFHLLAAGYALTLADGAAEAGALAEATGRRGELAAREALPAWARDGAGVAVRGGQVRVAMRLPSPLAELSRRIEVASVAWARPQGR
jgi:hypothetical protein